MGRENDHPVAKAFGLWKAVARSSQWRGYAIAVVGTGIAVALRWALHKTIGYNPIYITFYPVVLWAAVIGGIRPGLVATFLSALVVDYLFIKPFGLFNLSFPDAVGLTLFVLVNVGFSITGGTLRRRSEALRESNALLHLTCSATGVGLFDYNLDTDVNTWTPEAEAMHGLKPGEFGGTIKAWENLLHPDDRAKALASVQRALATYEPVEEEWRVRWPDGSLHWVVARYQAFRRSATKPARLVGINLDITARKQAEEALRQREEWFRTMADSIPELAWISRADGYSFWFNRRCFDYSGATQQELEGWEWQKVVEPSSVPRIMEGWKAALARGEPYRDLDFQLRGRDGRFRPFLANVVPLKDRDGRVALWFGTAIDISEFREREQALDRQARMIDLAPAATMVVRLDGKITFWSHGAEELYGWAREEAIGKRAMELLHTHFPERFEDVIARLKGGGTWSAELRQVTRSGRPVVVASYWLAERNGKGEVEEILESNTDITERKRLQEHLQDEVAARTFEVREAFEELEQMSYSMVHDMRAPLRAMQGFAQILEEECQECRRPPGSDYLKRIRQAATRLDRLVSDALNYQNVLREEPSVTRLEICKLLHGLIESYPSLQSNVADISVEFEELYVFGNESLLTQCLANVLENAVKFVAPGVHPCVRIWAEEAREDPGMVRIWVEDNGIGIPLDAREKIFKLFQRMHREEEYAGTGVGLAIVKKCVQRMHGHVGFESEVGVGSKFWVELPRAPAEVAEERRGRKSVIG